MGIGEIGDVDVISDGSSVRSEVISSERGEIGVALDCHHRPGDQFGFRITQLTKFALWIGAARIEMSKGHGSEHVGMAVIDTARAHALRYVPLRYFNVTGADPLSRGSPRRVPPI